ncbi:MAG: chromate resistance protein [Elusimicrobia bacterium]|nr:chromate resistance protein [Elusimicrobiota bacterium]
MKWVTREGARTDRVACPWLIRKFIDKDAEFLFVPRDQVLETAKRLGGKSFDTPGSDYTHRDGKCTFETLIEDYKLKDEALSRLAIIVHGADVSGDVGCCPESAGLLAIADGFHETTPDDRRKLELEFPVYDALYAYCRQGRQIRGGLMKRMKKRFGLVVVAWAAGVLAAAGASAQPAFDELMRMPFKEMKGQLAAPPRRASIEAGPGRGATDQRVPQMGGDPAVVNTSKLSMAEGVRQAEAKYGATIEAKFELKADTLKLSIYPIGKPVAVDAERNVFEELAGKAAVAPWAPVFSVFTDQKHLTRSARDLTLVQLSRITLADAIARASDEGAVYWAIPTIRAGRAGYGMYALDDGRPRYEFIDGEGGDERTADHPADLGSGPGAGATDARVPELGDDLSVARGSKLTMAQALARTEAKYGPMIEAKFELDDAKKLSLSLYPVGKGVDVDAERNVFQELAGDPTADVFAPTLAEFKVPDAEHLTRSARDLTLVQTSPLTLRQAVDIAQAALPKGFVYWAIPTIRDTRAGYGVYVLGSDNRPHYFFIR